MLEFNNYHLYEVLLDVEDFPFHMEMHVYVIRRYFRHHYLVKSVRVLRVSTLPHCGT